ncbi:MAG: ROK family protein, partial [Candidatus Omnitrophica bacterium]|nr:ROK family protein [Candidatus Omnitrophota bacterium]
LLLSSGRYLVTEEVSKDDLRLLRAINHEDIEAMMQILKRENPHSYQIIKDAFFESFPYDKKSNLSEELYVNHTIAKALEWLLLAKEGIISENKIPESKKDFVKKAEKVIVSINYIFIEEGFWDLKKRGDRIQKARNKGMRFYQVATSLSEEQEKRGSLLKERIFGKDDFVSLNGFIKTFIQSTGLPGNEKIIVRFPSEMRDRGTNDFTIELPDGLSEAYKGILSEYIAARVLNAMLNNGGTKSVIRCPEGWTNIIKRSLTRDKLYAKVKDRLETYYGKSSFEIQYNPTDAEALTKKQLQLIQEQQNPSISYQDTEGVYLGIDIGGSSIKLAAIVGGKEHMLGRINEKIYEKKDAQEYIELIKKSIATAHERLRNAMGVIRIDGIGVSWNAAIKNDTIVYGESMINRLGESEAKKVSRLPKDIKNWARQIYGPEVRVAIRNDGHMGAFQAAYSERRRDTAYLGLGFSIALGYISREGRNAPGLCELHFSRIDLSDTGHGVEYDIPGALGYYLGVRGVVKEGKKLNVVGDDVLDTSFEKAKHIVSQANAGDETKLSIAKTMGRYLAEEALSLYNHWPVEHVIVGGGLLTGKFGETMIEEAESILKREFPEVKVSLSLYNGNRLYVSAVGAARYASSMKREADILHTIEWLIQRVKTRCNVVFDSDIKKELVFEFGGEFAPSLITRSYTTRKGIADQKEYLKNLVYQEAILLYTATQSRGQNIPIRVSIDRSKLELMKEARDMLSDNIKDIIEESKGFWEEEIKKYSGDVHSFNEHSPERPPKISVNIASTSARFSSLLKRIKELKAGMQKDDFELVVV